MKKLIWRLSLLTLAVLFVLPVLACSTPGGTETTTAPVVAGTTEAPPSTVDENGYILSDLPELNYNDETVMTLYWSDREHEEFFVENTTGDNVYDALFERNAMVEETLHVKLDYFGTPGNASNIAAFTNVVKNSVAASEHVYDIIAGYSISTSSCAAAGLLQDMSKLDYINFDMPWWPDNLIEQATINDKLYFASGDISMNLLYMMYVCYFNQQFITDYNCESPYDLVDKNEWTNEKMFELSRGVYKDINANQKKDEGDQFGFYAQKLHSDAFFWGGGFTAIDNSGDALTVSDDWNSESVQDMLTQLCTFLYDTEDGLMITSGQTYVYFRDGLSMFWFDRARQGANLTDIEYGIVPIPKYSADQENFSCVMGNPFTLYGIISDEEDPDMMAAVLECMASESYRRVSPQLFEITMKYKYSSEEKAARMYDIVRANVVFDLGRIFYSSIGGIPATTWEACTSANIRTWMSRAKTTGLQMEKLLNILMKSFN